MKNVPDWDRVANWIGISVSKRLEFKSLNPTTDQCKQACWDYWLHHHPAPSWRILAGALYKHEWRKHGALEVLQMNYLKGKTIGYHSCLGITTCSTLSTCVSVVVVVLCVSVCYHTTSYIPCSYVKNKVSSGSLWHDLCYVAFGNSKF